MLAGRVFQTRLEKVRIFENILTFLAGITALLLLNFDRFPCSLPLNHTTTDESIRTPSSIKKTNSSGLGESCLQTEEIWIDPVLLSFSVIVSGTMRVFESNSKPESDSCLRDEEWLF